MAPSEPVMVGEYFQVQYIIEEGSRKDEFTIPVFKDLIIVNGPVVNGGTSQSAAGTQRLRNYVFTLVAQKPGRYLLPSTTATVNGIVVKSSSSYVYVAANNNQLQQNSSDLFLRSGEDAIKKIKANLFIRVTVDKKQCYTGEPIVATYKLYSRLDSKSDIVKNPGFYGFTVQDMQNLNDHILTTEMINGKAFDVHTIRKVQLYPLRSGNFTIDKMEVSNRVLFAKSYVNKKSEQQIEEGVYDHPNDIISPNTEVYETSMHTDPVAIEVKEPPLASRPANYNGATGKFSIKANLQNNKLNANNEGHLIVTISGKGNFTQLLPPVINWPKGIEGFEPIVTDELDKSQAPFPGTRTFNFPFVVSKSGPYHIPAISFSYFNPDTNTYSSLATKALKLSSSNFTKRSLLPDIKQKISDGHLLPVIFTVLLAIAIILALFLYNKKKLATTNSSPKKFTTISILMFDARANIETLAFYNDLQKGIYKFFAERFDLSEQHVSDSSLQEIFSKQKIPDSIQFELRSIIKECEVARYTLVDSITDKSDLLNNTEKLLNALE